MKSRKIVVLNSGGFDSVVLLHGLVKWNPDSTIHSIHFRYGERNQEEQQRSVDNVCQKLGVVNKTVTLPKIDWTANNFYKETNEFQSQYLEYRNLIFLAYALSYAESIGACEIYLATLKSHGYADTSEGFFNGINHFSEPLSNIKVVTPFATYEKEDLVYYAIKYGVEPKSYFSCDTPVNGEPCGNCADCEALKDIEDRLTINHPHKALVKSGYDYKDPTFLRLLKEQPLEEVRLLINNSCQLKCKHCFYGFEDTVSPLLTKEELYDVILQAEKMGVDNIHFSGKEPMFNDDILWYAHKMKEDNLNITFDIVTNGITIPKYAKELKECGLKKFYLSVDNILNIEGVRSVTNVVDKALEVCSEEDIEVEIFIDLHHNNYDMITAIVDYLTRYSCVHSVFIRTIKTIGNATNFTPLSARQLNVAHKQVVKCAEKYDDIFFTLNMGIECESVLYTQGGTELLDMVELGDRLYTDMVFPNYSLYLEDYCSRYANQVTVTPDGYVLGCASEVSDPHYDKLSAGNIKEDTLLNIRNKGLNSITQHCNEKFCGTLCKKCSFLE